MVALPGRINILLNFHIKTTSVCAVLCCVVLRTCQLVDDVLDYEAVDSQLGKPGGADLQLGLTTGPALFAWEEHEAMGPLIARKFAEDGDVEMVRSPVA